MRYQVNTVTYLSSTSFNLFLFQDRPKYKQLLKHAFIKKYEKEEVDVGAWYRATQRRLNGSSGDVPPKHRRDDPLRTSDALRGSSIRKCNLLFECPKLLEI